jgi:hypothetical protein
MDNVVIIVYDRPHSFQAQGNHEDAQGAEDHPS